MDLNYRGMFFLIFLALIGGLIKIIGGFLSGSRALIVDALTSFANIFALLVSIHYHLISFKPPDLDHHYGHRRFSYMGILGTMIAYSFVAGISVTILLYSWNYRVDIIGVYTAVMGFIVYSIVVYLSLRMGGSMRVYGFFTISELLESIITIFASLGGSLYSFLIDYAGGVILTSYIFVELYHAFRENIIYLTDLSPSRTLINDILSIFNSNDLVVNQYRFRLITEKHIHGDIVVKPDDCNNVLRLLEKIYRVKNIVKKKYPEVDLVISIDYDECIKEKK